MRNKPLRLFLGTVVFLYAVLFISLSYWQIFRPDLREHPSNPRHYRVFFQDRGRIYGRNGEILAFSEEVEGSYTRKYPDVKSLSHIVGYFHSRYGMNGLERIYDNVLRRRYDVFTTIDLPLQQSIESVFEGFTGAVVAIEPGTGQILAMVSSPSIDANRLSDNWSEYVADPRSPFVNRSSSGQYPPGSAIKPAVLAASLMEGIVSPSTRWVDEGSITFGNQTIRNVGNQINGVLDPISALAVSSNTVFAQIAYSLEGDLANYFRDFGLGQLNTLELSQMPGHVGTGPYSGFGYAQLGIGQADLLVTPLQMALIAGAVGNRGVLMEPYIVREVRGPFWLRQLRRPRIMQQSITGRTASYVTSAMIEAVRTGTARAASVPGVQVAGKTGTAENASGADHAWFIGFAPAENPRIAIAVIIEHGGFGGAVAAPIASRVFQAALANLKEG